MNNTIVTYKYDFRYLFSQINVLFCIIISMQLLKSCYSFTGGSVPPHLKTMKLGTVNDQSGYGNPEYKLNLTESLLNNFRRDGSFELVEIGGDAELSVSINSINEATISVNPGELETERRITVSCTVEYYDNVNKTVIWKKDFSSYGIYELKNAQTARNDAIANALIQLADDILLAVVSGW